MSEVLDTVQDAEAEIEAEVEAETEFQPIIEEAPQALELARQHLTTAIRLQPDSPSYLYWLSQVEFEAGDLAAARTACQRSLDLDANQLEGWCFLAELYLRLKRPGPAFKAAQQAIKLDRQHEEGWLLAARSALQSGKTEPARTCLERYLAQQAEPELVGPSVYTLLARVDLQANQPEQALAQLEIAQQRLAAFFIAPGADFMALWAQVLRRLGQFETALELYRQALQLAPNDAGLHAELGDAWFEQADYEQSLEAYRQAYELEPSNAQYHYMAGRAARYGANQSRRASRKSESLFQQALQRLEKATSLNPVNSNYWYELAEVQIALENYKPARHSLSQAIAQSAAFTESEAPQVHYLLLYAHTCQKLGDFESALQALNPILEVLPRDHNTWVELGELYMRQGQHSAAFNAFRQAELLAPDHPRYLALMARVLLKLGRLQEAHELVNEAIERAPDDRMIGQQLGVVLLEGGQVSEALPYLLDAVEELPSNPEYRYWLGRAYWRMGDVEDAIQSFREAIAGDPLEANWHAELAEIYLRRQDYESALQTLQLLVKLDPDLLVHAYNLAIALANTGDVLTAIHTLKDRMELPDWVNIPAETEAEWHYLLGRLNLEYNRLDEALLRLNRACELAPDRESYRVDLVRCRRLRGEPPELLKNMLAGAVRTDQSDLRPFEELAYIYEAGGQHEHALSALASHLQEALAALH